MKNCDRLFKKSAKTKDKITYIPHEGVIAEDGNGTLASFKLGLNIERGLGLPYVFEDEYEDNEGYYSFPLYMFFNETFRISTKRDKTTIEVMSCTHSFILEGHELIGMDFGELLLLNILHFDYVHNNYYGLGNNINFRYYAVYHNLEYKLSVYVWRKKIREVLVNGNFFIEKKYDNPEYLDFFKVIKL